MFVKAIDGRNYIFRAHRDAATLGNNYWVIVEIAPELTVAPFAPAPIPEEHISKIHQLLEKHAGFPNMPAPDKPDEGGVVWFKNPVGKDASRHKSTKDLRLG